MDDYYSTYDVYSENDITEINEKEIVFSNGLRISFEDCQKTFAHINCTDTADCIGEKDNSDYSFMLYYEKKPIMIKFLKKSFFGELFSKSIDTRFREFEKRLIQYGYTFYDLSRQTGI